MLALFYLALFSCSFVSSNGERLREQIYSPINGGAACFRRLNGTHQAGCSSSYNGAVGVVEMIKDIEDAKWLVTNATAGPYMAIVDTSLFNSAMELFMEHPENVAGVVVYDTVGNKNRASSYSQDLQCPNEYASDPGSKCPFTDSQSVWNLKGSGLLRRDIPFPLLLLSMEHNQEIDKIEKCYERYNKDKENQLGQPLCSVQLNSFMYAAVNSEVCMRRSVSTAFLAATKVCDPLGDYNVYYSLYPRDETENVTLVTARIDSASLFDGVSPGAATSVSGMATLLATAAILSKMIPDTNPVKSDNNILFTLFNGEAFDYIGSQRVAYDLSRGRWPEYIPLSPENIKLHIEVGQIGGSLFNQSSMTPNTKWPIYAFTPNSEFDSELLTFVNIMSTNYNQYNESFFPKYTQDIPPSSIHSFRRILANYTDTTLPEIVLVDHDEEGFTNMYYNSALDEYYQIGYTYRNISWNTDGNFISTEKLLAKGVMNETDVQVKISRLATALSRTLYKRVIDTDYNGNLTVSAHLVDEILYCYMRSQACPLMKAADYGTSSEDNLSPSQPPLYVGVAHWASNPAVFTGHLLVLLAGTQMPADKTQCKDMDTEGYSFYWLKGWDHTGVCMRTTMNMSQAISPAFIIDGYDMTSRLYSTWTESVWQSMSARLFVSAGGGGATAAAASGVCATVIAAFFTFWIRKHKDILFADLETSAATDDATSGILRTVNC